MKKMRLDQTAGPLREVGTLWAPTAYSLRLTEIAATCARLVLYRCTAAAAGQRRYIHCRPKCIKCSKPHRHRRLSFACKRRTPLNSKTLSPPPATCHRESNPATSDSLSCLEKPLVISFIKLLTHLRKPPGGVTT